MFIFRKQHLLAVLALAVLSAQAKAAVITETLNVSATGFVATGGSSVGPIDPMTLSFTISYDPTQFYFTPSTTGITLNSVNVPHTAPLSFTAFPGSLDVSTIVAAVPGGPASNGFLADIGYDSSGFYLTSAQYYSGAGYYIDPTGGNGRAAGTVTDGISAVPLPATLPMFGTALLGLVGFGIGKRRPA